MFRVDGARSGHILMSFRWAVSQTSWARCEITSLREAALITEHRAQLLSTKAINDRPARSSLCSITKATSDRSSIPSTKLVASKALAHSGGSWDVWIIRIFFL